MRYGTPRPASTSRSSLDEVRRGSVRLLAGKFERFNCLESAATFKDSRHGDTKI